MNRIDEMIGQALSDEDRELFEREFPGDACARTVPGGPSIACSSAAAVAWDPAFAAAADPSGRSVAGVHAAPAV